MGLLRRDERGGLQFPEAMSDLPRLGVLTSDRLWALKAHSADDDSKRAFAARLKLKALARQRASERRDGFAGSGA